jgi:hypothetical protein
MLLELVGRAITNLNFKRLGSGLGKDLELVGQQITNLNFKLVILEDFHINNRFNHQKPEGEILYFSIYVWKKEGCSFIWIWWDNQ